MIGSLALKTLFKAKIPIACFPQATYFSRSTLMLQKTPSTFDDLLGMHAMPPVFDDKEKAEESRYIREHEKKDIEDLKKKAREDIEAILAGGW
jgi:hypothetical protein